MKHKTGNLSEKLSEEERKAIAKINEKYEKDKRYNNQSQSVDYEINNLYSLRSRFGRYFESEKLYYLIELLNYEKISLVNKSILDVGCHTGLILNMLANLKESSKGLKGIDIMHSYTERAKKINSSIEYETKSALDIGQEEQYDLILLIYILSEIYPLSLREKVIRKLAATQKKGDYIIIFNFKRLPYPFYLLLKVIYPLNKFLPFNIPSPDFGREINLDDQAVKEQFKEYEVVKSYSFVFLLARKMIHDFKFPVIVMRAFSGILPKYYMVLLKKVS